VNEAILERNEDKFPQPRELKTIDDLGGWSKVNDELFIPRRARLAKIEEEAGVSTAK
jgi:sulfate transport system substrate-binding protein